jgi:uncharacterized glyoxalase superfamily protein PhnB
MGGRAVWNSLTPQLPVADVEETQAWYRDVLGCTIAFTQQSYGAVRLGKTEIFFHRSAGPLTPACCCVRVDDADALCAIYRERGAEIVEPIDTRPWGMREFTLRDLNGHYFRIGHSTRRQPAPRPTPAASR